MAQLSALVDEGHNFAPIAVPRVTTDTRVLSEVTRANRPKPARRADEVRLVSADRGVGAWPAEAIAADLGDMPGGPTSILRSPSNELTTPETIYFGDGSTRLGTIDQARLRRAAKLFSRHGGQIRLVGHASPSAQDPTPVKLIANFAMSLKRAQAVARGLIDRGVPPSAIVVEAVGDSAPIYGVSIPQSEAYNRRVEIVFEDL
jgi:outer membrane protein OmpA-like peptidoglycan-associated protein